MTDDLPAKANPVVHADNERVRVTEWQFESGAETGFHRHEFDYVVVPLSDGLLRLADGAGQEKQAPLEKGVAYYRAAGVEHNVTNAGDDYLAFVEVEIKS